MRIPQRATPSIEDLRAFYVGKNISEVPKPAIVLDSAVVTRHCKAVQNAVKALGVGFRAHVKTHKVRVNLENLDILINDFMIDS